MYMSINPYGVRSDSKVLSKYGKKVLHLNAAWGLGIQSGGNFEAEKLS